MICVVSFLLDKSTIKISNITELGLVFTKSGDITNPIMGHTLKDYCNPLFTWSSPVVSDSGASNFTLSQLLYIFLYGTPQPFDTSISRLPWYNTASYPTTARSRSRKTETDSTSGELSATLNTDPDKIEESSKNQMDPQGDLISGEKKNAGDQIDDSSRTCEPKQKRSNHPL